MRSGAAESGDYLAEWRKLPLTPAEGDPSDIAARELSNQGFDIDFEDESGAQAAAFMAAQQAA